MKKRGNLNQKNLLIIAVIAVIIGALAFSLFRTGITSKTTFKADLDSLKTSTVPRQTGCETQFDAQLCKTPECMEKKNCWQFCESFCEKEDMKIKASLNSQVNGEAYCNCVCTTC